MKRRISLGASIVVAIAAVLVLVRLLTVEPSAPARVGGAVDTSAAATAEARAVELAAPSPTAPAPSADDEVATADSSTPTRAAVEPQALLRAAVVHAGLPSGVTAIVVLAHDGSSLVDLAAERGHDPLHLFGTAFQFAVAVEGPDDAAFAREFDRTLAVLLRPEHRRHELTPDVVATLDITSARALHVGVALYGQTIGWNRVSRGSRETVFVLPADAFERGLAALTLRPVVVSNGPPARDARVTLRAEHSVLRRPNQTGVEPDLDGLVQLTDVVPGEYEVLVETAAAQWNQRVVLVAGERRDLGEIVLAASAPIEVRTLAIDGTPIVAWVEIAPLDTALEVEELFPSHLNRRSKDGAYSLLAPSQPALVRARVIGDHNADTRLASPVVVLDPRVGLPTTLELRLAAPVPFVIESRNSAVAQVHVRDAGGLLLELREPSAGADHSPGLPPGTYTAELRATDGAVLAQQSFTLVAGEHDRAITIP